MIISDDTPPLHCSCILLRLGRNKNHVNKKTGELTPKAFVLREAGEARPAETSLSLLVKENCVTSGIDDVRTLLNEFHGVGSLHTGHIRDINLLNVPELAGIILQVEEEQKEEDPRPIWARIINMPLKSQNERAVEVLSDLLAEQCRKVDPILKPSNEDAA